MPVSALCLGVVLPYAALMCVVLCCALHMGVAPLCAALCCVGSLCANVGSVCLCVAVLRNAPSRSVRCLALLRYGPPAVVPLRLVLLTPLMPVHIVVVGVYTLQCSCHPHGVCYTHGEW